MIFLRMACQSIAKQIQQPIAMAISPSPIRLAAGCLKMSFVSSRIFPKAGGLCLICALAARAVFFKLKQQFNVPAFPVTQLQARVCGFGCD
jgi:hypothetical protein